MQTKPHSSNVRRTLHYYWWAILKHRGYFLGMLLSTPAVIVLRNILGPLFLSIMIGKLTDGLPADQIIPQLLPYGIGVVVSYTLGSLLLGELRLFWVWRGELLAMYDLSALCFDTVSSQSMQFHSDRFSGSLVSQTNKFTSSFERFIDEFIWNILPIVISLVSITIILFPKVPLFTIGLLIFAAIYTIIAALTYGKINHLGSAEASAQSRQTGQLSDSISNIQTVKSYARESHERHRYANFQRASLSASNALMKGVISRDVFFTAVNIGITTLLVIFMMTGTTTFGISIATLVLIINYSQQVMDSLWGISRIFRDFNRIFGDAHDMTEILDTVDTVVDLPGAKPLHLARGGINFHELTFHHQDAKSPIFTDFNLTIKPGERVGLVGVSGSGKTTLTKLLLRFADPDSGTILIDDQDIKHVTQKSLRRHIAYVPQETDLFHRSISENIAYGKPDATQDEIIRAARLANAHDFITELPEGYDTLVGERGIKLSGGQRQRIAIARAILKDAPILVLDEATSALDSESEALIQDALEKLMRGRTSVVIAHRLSTVAHLDRIVVLDHGHVVEEGTHAELLKSGGTYQSLWTKQSQ